MQPDRADRVRALRHDLDTRLHELLFEQASALGFAAARFADAGAGAT